MYPNHIPTRTAHVSAAKTQSSSPFNLNATHMVVQIPKTPVMNQHPIGSRNEEADTQSPTLSHQLIYPEVTPDQMTSFNLNPIVHNEDLYSGNNSRKSSPSYHDARGEGNMHNTRPVLLKDISLTSYLRSRNFDSSKTQRTHLEHRYIPKVPLRTGPQFLFPNTPTQSGPTIAKQRTHSSRSSLHELHLAGAENTMNNIPKPESEALCYRMSEQAANGAQTFTHPRSNCLSSVKAQRAIKELAQTMTTRSSRKICACLANISRRWHHCMTLDELYHLLYGDEILDLESGLESGQTHQSVPIDNAQHSENRRIGLEIFHAILDTYKGKSKLALDLPVLSRAKQDFNSATVHECLRSLLAMKVLLSAAKIMEHKHVEKCGIPRDLLYKVYFILCHKLIQKYPSILRKGNHNLILGPSPLGKIIKRVYPDLKSRRFGRRGESKVHYLDLMWNEAVVGQDILGLLNLDMEEIQDHFRGKKTYLQVHQQQNLPKLSQASASPSNITDFSHSFINLSQRFPEGNCSPRMWASNANKEPKLSEWTQNHVERCLTALKPYGLELADFTQELEQNVNAEGNTEYLARCLATSLKMLMSAAAPPKAYMHLYLIILLKILPLIIASDQEVPIQAKTQLRQCVQHCVYVLESENSTFASLGGVSLNIFSRVLRSMIYLNEASMGVFKCCHTETTVKQIDLHIEKVGKQTSGGSNDTLNVEDRYIQTIMMCMLAHDFNLSNESWIKDEEHALEVISSVALIFKKAQKMLKASISAIPILGSVDSLGKEGHNLPYQIFQCAFDVFHDGILADPLILKFPIPVITSIILHLVNSVQYSSFGDPGKRDPEMSSDTFKCLGVCYMMVHGYMSMISEVVALSEDLAREEIGT